MIEKKEKWKYGNQINFYIKLHLHKAPYKSWLRNGIHSC